MILPTLALLATLAPVPAPAAEVKNPDVFTALVSEEADSLDPAWAQDVASMSLLLNIYETLFQFDGSSTEKLIPLIAQTVPTRENGLISPDGRTYTIPIRKGIKFHDGTPMTPEDVRYSLLRFLLADRAAGPSWLLMEPLLGRSSTRDDQGVLLPRVWEDADRAVTVQGGSLVLRLPRPYAPLLGILAARAPLVVSREWAAKNGDWDGTEATWRKFNNPSKQSSPFFERANGTGPFKLGRWDRKTKEVLLVRNDGYWRAPAKIRRVAVKAVGEFGLRKLMLQAGDADSISAGRSLLSQLQGLQGVRIIDDLTVFQMPAVFFTYDINPGGNAHIGSGRLDGRGIPPDFFSDKDVRKAFAYAVDYKGLVADVLRGKAAQATGCVPQGLLGHDPEGRTYQFDPQKSEEHFRKALHGRLWDVGFKLTFASYSGDALGQTIGQMLKRGIEGLNPKFQIDLRVFEWPTFLDARNSSKLPIFMTAWSAKYPDPHDFAFAFLHSKGLYPSTQKFKNPEFDGLIEKANAEFNTAERRRLYAQLQDLEFEETPHLVLVDAPLYRTQRDWVKGWRHNPVFPNAPYGSYFYTIWKE